MPGHIDAAQRPCPANLDIPDFAGKLDRTHFSAKLRAVLMNEAADASSPPDHYAVFRLRDFRLYLTGRLAAVVGQQMVTVAVGWELYQRTHSPLALGLVGLAEMIAMVLLHAARRTPGGQRQPQAHHPRVPVRQCLRQRRGWP